MKRAAGSDAQPDAKKAAVDNPHGVEMDESRVVRPLKAYKVRADAAAPSLYHRSSGGALTDGLLCAQNQEFLMSTEARTIRIMAEHHETLQRLEANSVKSFILFFSSARGRSHKQLAEQRAVAQGIVDAAGSSAEDKDQAAKKLEGLGAIEWMCPFYDGVTALAERLTRWAMAKHPDPLDKCAAAAPPRPAPAPRPSR